MYKARMKIYDDKGELLFKEGRYYPVLDDEAEDGALILLSESKEVPKFIVSGNQKKSLFTKMPESISLWQFLNLDIKRTESQEIEISNIQFKIRKLMEKMKLKVDSEVFKDGTFT